MILHPKRVAFFNVRDSTISPFYCEASFTGEITLK